MKENIYPEKKMKKRISFFLSIILVLTAFFSTTLPVSAASTVRGNASKSYVTGNASAQRLPSSINTVNVGDKIWLNAQVDNRTKAKSITFYIDPPGSQGMTKIGQESARGFLRYAYWDYRVPKSGNYSYKIAVKPVSYTHLDVYKRQVLLWLWV